MPIYEYECKKCKALTEVFQKVSDKPPVKCKKCGGKLERLISRSAIQFKGSGWYVTDYGGKNGKLDKKSEEKSESSNTTSGDKSETKEAAPAKKTSDTTKKPSAD